MHLAKHVPLGDLIFLDRERCIQCARCTRFQEEVAGDAVLAFHERGRTLQIITNSTPPFDSYFSGNTTDICPVGALTTADFRFGARPWELTEVPSICPHCPVGCNISASTRLDRETGGKILVKRIMPRQNEAVNEIWICDKGRFGHHHGRSAERLTSPLIRKQGELVPATWAEALAVITEQYLTHGENVGAIAGPMLSNEDLWELRRLVEGAGNDTFGLWPNRMGGAAYITQAGLTSGSNFKAMGKGTTILVIASDLEEEAPVWYLRVKLAAERGARLVTLNARPTELDRFAKETVRYRYGGEISALQGVELNDKENLVILVGGEGLDRAGHTTLMQAAASILVGGGYAGKLNNGLLAVWPGANTQGAFDLGFDGETTELILKKRPALLFLADADVIGEGGADETLFENRAETFTVVSEMFMTKTAALADVVLPRQSFLERDGTFTNGERRVQRFYTAQAPLEGTRPDWRVFGEITQLYNGPRPKLSAAAVMQEIPQQVPHYAGMSYANLAKVEAQFPDVGGVDLYYGGTAYKNEGGLGVQWPIEVGSAPEAPKAGKPRKPKKDELLIVPITELYDRKAAFQASEGLMKAHIPAPYVILNSSDAQKLGLADGDEVTVHYATYEVRVTARVQETAPVGVALLPRHLGDQPAPVAPIIGSVRKVEVVAHV
jgi:NADH-quinone oxidoreductase subunit G